MMVITLQCCKSLPCISEGDMSEVGPALTNAFVAQMGLHMRSDGTIDTNAFKIVYVAPMKALVAEMVGNFSKRLESYGIQVLHLSLFTSTPSIRQCFKQRRMCSISLCTP